MSVVIAGLGYIGLPTALVMANNGNRVLGVDTDSEKVSRINRGLTTIKEPGLEVVLRKCLNAGSFRASDIYGPADVYIITVPTPLGSDYTVDTTFIFDAAASIAPLLRGGELIILESTVPPHTTQRMAEHILKLRPDLTADDNEGNDNDEVIFFAHCPERILSGNALTELVDNDRIIGGTTPLATEKAMRVYSTFCHGKLHATDALTAETAKLTENAFRDVNIAFANELSIICETIGVNVWELIELANHHPRVNILQPGPGVGGHCIAVDPWFIVASAPENSRLIRCAREVNDYKPHWILEKIHTAIKSSQAKTIALLGITFKADIDDLRTSPALSIAEACARTFPEIEVLIVEPNIDVIPVQLQDNPYVKLVGIEEACQKANVITLLVDHQEFKGIPATYLKGKKIIDTKGLWR